MRCRSRCWSWCASRLWMPTLLACALILPALPLPIFTAADPEAVPRRASRKMETRIEVSLAVSGELRLGETLMLDAMITPLDDAPEVFLRWGVPEGGQLLDGPVEESLGAMAAGETRTVTRHVRLTAPGTDRIGVEATFMPHPAITYGDADVYFVTVDETGGTISEVDPRVQAQLQAEIPPGIGAEVTAIHPEDPNSPDADCANIFGRVTRVDRVFNGSGFTDSVVPATGVIVEIWEDDPIFDDHDGTYMLTEDGNGEFGWTACTGDGLFDDTREFYVKVLAKSEGTIDEDVIKVKNEIPYQGPNGIGYRTIYQFRTQGTMEITGVGNVDFGTFALNEAQSSVINIAEAAYDAWKFWHQTDPGDNDYDDITILWSAGAKKDSGTHYTPFWDEMHVRGDVDPDEWDDSVIMHEWGHFADDKWGCDDNPGGAHSFSGHYDRRLSWGEGFPNFYQSAVRAARGDADPHFYRDANGMGGCRVCADFENVDTLHPDRLGDTNESAVAATLWDLIDGNNERQDNVNLNFRLLQRVFQQQGDDCTFKGYFKTWASIGGPTDTDVAAIVTQNTTIADIFGLAAAKGIAEAQAIQAAEAAEAGIFPVASGEIAGEGHPIVALPEVATSEDFRWWERLTFIVDNSKSMAGQRIDAVKNVLDNRVDVLSNLERGVEFRLDTFNNASPTNTQVFAGQFYPESFKPAIAALTTIAADDPGCDVNAFPALQQAVAGQTNVDAWLFTDNYPAPAHTPIEAMRAELSTRDVRATFALLQSPGDVSCLSPGIPNRTRQFQLQRQLLFAGAPSPTEPAHSIVPYLLTALATGGQFFFVDEDQLDSATQILQAQINQTAGAGRWSDYVSNRPTYRYDRLASWEYEWLDAEALGAPLPTRPGGLSSEGYVDVTLPAPFMYYTRTATTAHVYENGYITFDDNFGEAQTNTDLPNPAPPNAALYPYWDDLEWDFVVAANIASANTEANPEATQDGPFGTIYTAEVDDWFVIHYHRYFSPTANCPALTPCEEFEVLLNLETGEIRYQYQVISGDVASATIGLESWGDMNPMDGVEVSVNNPDGAESGMGYRFWPVPPQPLKTYTVSVDATMQSIGFLLTGFDGTLAPMVVRSPNGVALNCNNTAANLCINLGNVQYVQTNVDASRAGVWTVEISPGASGAGTFAFSSMAAGPLPAVSPSDHTRPAFANSVFLIDMGQPVDGNRLDAHFRTPGNALFGTPFALFDDGKHDDGAAGDGLFGSNALNPGASGSAYLWVEGKLNDVAFRRMDTKLFSFQPLRLTSPARITALDAENPFDVRIFNDDTISHTYALRFQAPLDWRVEVDAGGNISIPVAAGQSVLVPLKVSVGISDTVALARPSGYTGQLNIAVLEVEQGAMYDSTTIEVTRKRRVQTVEIFNPNDRLYPGDTPVYLQVGAFDNTGAPVADGTRIDLSTTLGAISPTVFLQGGWADVRFVPGDQTGTAMITATSLNDRSASTEIEIETPRGENIELVSSETELPADGESTAKLTVTVRDALGRTLQGPLVRIIVNGDGEFGAVGDEQKSVEGRTNANGNFVATFTAGDGVGGTVGIRAELLRGEDAIDTASVEIELLGPPEESYELFVPVIRRR